jgi:hypothetical protein
MSLLVACVFQETTDLSYYEFHQSNKLIVVIFVALER